MALRQPTVYVEVLGEKEVERTLYFIGDQAVDLRIAFWEIVGYFYDMVSEEFATMGGRSGNPWAPPNEDYVSWKWKHGKSIELLKASEDMYRALTGDSPNSIQDKHPEYLVYGADLPQFAYQQGNTGDGHMPVRIPVNLTPADIRTVTGMIMDRIISGAGLRPGGSFSTAANGRKYYSQRGANGQFVKRGR